MISFPCTKAHFLDNVLLKLQESIGYYTQAGGGTIYRRYLEDDYVLIQTLISFYEKSLLTPLITEYQKITRGRAMITITNIPDNRSTSTCLKFWDEDIILGSLSDNVLQRINYHLYNIPRENDKHQLINMIPDIETKVKQYDRLSHDNKKLFFKDSLNWNLIHNIYQYNKYESGIFFYPNNMFLKYFDFSTQSDEAMNLFKTLWDQDKVETELHVLAYGTIYFDYMMAQEDYLKRFFSDSRNLYQFPFDNTNVKMLIDKNRQLAVRKKILESKIINSKWVEDVDRRFKKDLLEHMSTKIKFGTREQFIETITQLCDDLGIIMTEGGIQEWYLLNYSGYYGNYDVLMDTFYGCGVFQKSEDELIDWFKKICKTDKRKNQEWRVLKSSVKTCGGRSIWEPGCDLKKYLYSLELPSLEVKLFVIWLDDENISGLNYEKIDITYETLKETYLESEVTLI